MTFASTGSVTLKLKQNVLITKTSERMTSIRGCLRIHTSPSRVPARIFGRSNRSSGKNSETRIRSRQISTAR